MSKCRRSIHRHDCGRDSLYRYLRGCVYSDTDLTGPSLGVVFGCYCGIKMSCRFLKFVATAGIAEPDNLSIV